MGGTVTVTTTGEDTAKLVFNLEDNKGNHITGTYEGGFRSLSSSDFEEAPRRAPLRH